MDEDGDEDELGAPRLTTAGAAGIAAQCSHTELTHGFLSLPLSNTQALW